MIWAYVDKSVQDAVKLLSKQMGISISEYVRGLVIADLDGRSFFTTQFKEKMQQTQTAQLVKIQKAKTAP
jgi:hypothetical protein